MLFYDYRLANCILNSETARSQAPMFAIEHDSKVDYFELPPCYYAVKSMFDSLMLDALNTHSRIEETIVDDE